VQAIKAYRGRKVIDPRINIGPRWR